MVHLLLRDRGTEPPPHAPGAPAAGSREHPPLHVPGARASPVLHLGTVRIPPGDTGHWEGRRFAVPGQKNSTAMATRGGDAGRGMCTERSGGQEPRAACSKHGDLRGLFLKVKNNCRVSLHSTVTPSVWDNFTKMLSLSPLSSEKPFQDLKTRDFYGENTVAAHQTPTFRNL